MFRPTAESIPRPDATLLHRSQSESSLPANFHPLNPVGFLLHAALTHPDKLALSHPDVPHPAFYSYRIWAQRVQNLAYALIHAGIRPGDRVAVLAPNSPMIADAHFGVLAARAVLTPINIRLTPHEIKYILDHSQAKLILVDHEYLHLVPDTNIISIVCHDTGSIGDPYEHFLSTGRKFSAERGWPGLDAEPDEDAPAALCYTSGTTGRPKGVLTTLRGSYLAAVANVFEARINPDSSYLWVLPMFHAAGWTFPWANVFACATQITIRQVNYPQIWKHLLHSGVTHYCGAPTVQIGIVNDPSRQPLQHSVYAIIAGSAPTAQLIGQLEQIGIKPVHVYGLTLMGPLPGATINLPGGHGFATAQNVRVAYPPKHEGDQQLVDVPKDGCSVGEVVTRGNIVMKEYFKDAEATRKAFRGGYFHSGDLAVMHPDGVVQIMDRSKDIIISGGENASSLAIELELASHPHVLEVSVVARPHPKWGERPMAFVILRPEYTQSWSGNGAGIEAELKRYARTLLPGFACPEWVQVVEKLPKTSTGKILKTDLRKIAAKL